MRGIRGRRDTTHAPIRDGLRALGWTVLDNGDAGNDEPDLIGGKDSITLMIECKSPGKKETPEQQRKRLTWKGAPWIVARSLAEVLAAHEEIKRRKAA